MAQHDFQACSSVDSAVKDMALVLHHGQQSRFPLPLSSAAMNILLAASARGDGGMDDAAIVAIYELLGNVPSGSPP